MDNVTDKTPPGWAEILDESLAEIDAGLLVSSDEVHGMFREAKAQRKPEARAPCRRAPGAH
jgi:hypothetical protein